MAEGGTAHVIGAGLAGLAAAVRLADSGRRVRLWEAAPQAGGRVRSFFDDRVGGVIDNGAHLVLAGNRDVRAYLDTIAATDRVRVADGAAFPFFDKETKARWHVRFGRSRVPFWLLCPASRPPGAGAVSFMRDVWRLLRASPSQTVTAVIPATSPWMRPFWNPLSRAVLNAAPEDGAACLLAAVLREAWIGGGAGLRPVLAKTSLDDAFIQPALRFLEGKGALVRFGCRLKVIEMAGGQAARLVFTDETVSLGSGDAVVLAVPAYQATEMVDGLTMPEGTRAILNAHFHLDDGAADACPVARGAFTGIVGGVAEWAFRRGRVLSVTVSAADALMDEDADQLAARLWADVAALSGLAREPVPPHRVIKERRATVAATPENETRRPGTKTRWPNLFLAGDGTKTGLPGTIEGAVRSGFRASDAVMAGL